MKVQSSNDDEFYNVK